MPTRIRILFVALMIGAALACSSSGSTTLDGYQEDLNQPDIVGVDGFEETILPDGTEATEATEATEPAEAVEEAEVAEVEEVKEVETETEIPVEPPVVTCALTTSSGTVGSETDVIALTAEDEPLPYKGSLGFQVDVVVQTVYVENGQMATLFLRDKQVTQKAVQVSPASGVGAVTFPNVTLDHDTVGYPMRVEVTNQGGEAGSCEKTLTVDTGLCSVSAALLPATEGCVAEDASPAQPGFQLRFSVTNAGYDCDQAFLSYQVGAAGEIQQTEALPLGEAGGAVILVTVSQDEGGLNGVPVSVMGHVTSSAHPEKANVTNAIDLVVDTDAPVVSLSAPAAGALTLANDADGVATNGVQIDVAGAVTGLNPGMAGNKVVLTGAGAAITLPEPEASFLFDDVSFAADADTTLVVTATDACGWTGSAQVGVQVFTRTPLLQIVEPSAGTILLAKNDANPLTNLTYDGTARVLATDLPIGSQIIVQCRKDALGEAFAEVGRVTIEFLPEDRILQVPITLNTQTLGNAIRCVAQHDYPNPSQSPEVALTVGLPGPGLTLVKPVEGRLTNKATLTIEGLATRMDGRSLDLLVTRTSDGSTALTLPAFATVQSGGVFHLLDISGLGDGAYSLLIEGSDQYGNQLADQPGAETSRAFTVDRTAPTLALTTPATLTFAEVSSPDEDATTPGYQKSLTFTVTGETSPVGAQVCVSTNGSFETCKSVTSPTGTIVFSGITLAVGSNPVQARVTDKAGNASAPQQWTVTRDSVLPRVEFLQPLRDTATRQDTVTVVMQVSLAGVPATAATVFVTRGGVEVSSTSAGVDGAYTLEVPLDVGTNRLQARAIADARTAYSPIRTVVYKTTAPTATFDEPTVDGAVFNLASPACSLGSNNCVLTVAATTVDVEDGSEATLRVVCGATTTDYAAAVDAGALAFEDVVLTDQRTCTLFLELTDLAGQKATAGPVAVTVDRVAPGLTTTNLPPFLLRDDDADSFKEGLQFKVTVGFRGLGIGRVVTLTFDTLDDEGSVVATKAYNATVSSAASDAQVKTLAFGSIDVPTGRLAYRFETQDAAGNPATALTGNMLATADLPLVWLYFSTFVEENSCTSDLECGLGRCIKGACFDVWNAGTARTVFVNSQGILYGSGISNNFRVCSDNPAVEGDACTTAGSHTVVYGTSTSPGMNFTLNTLPDGAHKLSVEGLANPATGEWVSSLEAPSLTDDQRYRMIYQDTVKPTVTSLQLTSDKQPPAGFLNAAEKAAEPDELYHAEIVGSEAGIAIVYVDGLKRIELPLDADGIDVPLTLLDGVNKTLQAKIRDDVGNEGPLGPTPALTFTVDTIAPTLSFVQPAKAVLIAGDSADAIVRSGEAGVAVELFNDATSLGTRSTGADFRATFAGALSADGTYTLKATGHDAALNAVNATPTPATTLVDRTPPAVTLIAPTLGQELTDADPAQGGFQADVRFSTAQGATSWVLRLATGCDATYTTCGAPAQVAAGAVSSPGAIEPDQRLTLPGGATVHYLATVEVGDANGNKASATAGFSIAVTGCLVSIEGLPADGYVNNERCTPAGEDCASVPLALTASYLGTCPGVTTLELWVDDALTEALPVNGGQVTFAALTLDEDTTPTIEVRATDGAATVGASGDFPLIVDLTDPVVTFVADYVGPFLTPSSGATEIYALADDQDGGAPDLQIPLSVLAHDTHLAGGSFLAITRTDAGGSEDATVASPGLPLALSATPYSGTVLGLTLPHGEDQTIRAIFADAAGNQGETRFQADVDIQAPAAIELAELTADALNRRLPAVTLDWVAPGDDGDAGAPAAAYDIRFSRQPIEDEADFEAACQAILVTSTDPFGAPKAAGEVESFTVTGPDVRDPGVEENGQPCKLVVGTGNTSYYFAVRGVDEAGNASALDTNSTVSTSNLNLKMAKISYGGTLAEASNPSLYRRLKPVRDVNDDGRGDWVAYSSTLARACVFLGHDDGATGDVPDMEFTTDQSAYHRCYAADGGTQWIGNTTAGLGDVNGDEIDDFAFGQASAANGEAIDIYLGVDTAPPGLPALPSAPFLRIRGQVNGNTSSRVFPAGDFDGNGLGDIAVGSIGTNRVFVILSEPTWTGGDAPLWQPGEPRIEIDLTNPVSLTGFRVVTIVLADPDDPATNFGSVVEPLGDIFPDEGVRYDDLAIFSQRSPNAVYLVRGRAVLASFTITLHNTLAPQANPDDSGAVKLVPEVGYSTSWFGYVMAGGHDLDGRGVPDLVLQHDAQGVVTGKEWSIYVLYGEDLQNALGTQVKGVDLPANPVPVGDGVLVGTRGVILLGAFQSPAVLGDFDGEGSAFGSGDLALARYNPAFNGWGSCWIRQNGSEADAGIGFGMFPYPDVTLSSPYPLEPGGAFGYSVNAVGDVNGDGYPDLLVGTYGGGFPTIVY